MRNVSRERNKSKMKNTPSDFSNSVHIFDSRYYIYNKRLLSYVGLWPYQPVYQQKIRSLFLVFVSVSLIVPQTLQLIHSWGKVDSFIECFSPLVTNIGSNIKVANCVICKLEMKKLLDEIRNDWACTGNFPELKILHEHGQKGRRCTIAYVAMVYTAVAAWTSVPLIPIVMDLVIPLNESRPHIQYFATDYRVDPNKYFYPIFFHAATVTVLCMLVYVAFDTIYMMFALHACAMFNILRYRLENITEGHNENDSILNKTNNQENLYYQRMGDCIIKHKRCIEYIRVKQAMCGWVHLILVGLNMLVISFTGSQIVAKNTSLEDMLRFSFFALAQVVHLFCISLPGQWIMETSTSLPNWIYSSNWYLMSPRLRRPIVFFIRRSIEPCVITAGKMYIMSMENFCCVLQTSMSYLTLLTSMQ